MIGDPSSSIKPPPPTERSTRATRWFDVNPPTIGALAALIAVVILCITVDWKKFGSRLRESDPKSITLPISHPTSPTRQIPAEGLHSPKDLNPVKPEHFGHPEPTRATKREVPLAGTTEPEPSISALQAQVEKTRMDAEAALAESRRIEAETTARQNELKDEINRQAALTNEARERQSKEQTAEAARLNAAVEAERIRRQREEEARRLSDPLTNYRGPRSGSITWEGSIKGKGLVSFNSGHPDLGRVVEGSIPSGVPLLFQPSDTKRVGIASAPSPRNGYDSFVIRVEGKGETVRFTLYWSVP